MAPYQNRSLAISQGRVWSLSLSGKNQSISAPTIASPNFTTVTYYVILLLFTTHYSLLTTHYSLLTTHYSPGAGEKKKCPLSSTNPIHCYQNESKEKKNHPYSFSAFSTATSPTLLSRRLGPCACRIRFGPACPFVVIEQASSRIKRRPDTRAQCAAHHQALLYLFDITTERNFLGKVGAKTSPNIY